MSTSSQCSSSSGGGQSARVVVALDFGTTFSGFAYAHTDEPDKVYKFYDWPCLDRVSAEPYCKTQTSLYYEPIVKHEPQDVGSSHVAPPPAFKRKSWGWSALVDYTNSDRTASRASCGAAGDKLNRSSPIAIDTRRKGLSAMDSEAWRPCVAKTHNPRGNKRSSSFSGFFATKFKLYLADQAPGNRNRIPAGLSVEIIIADYLRCISGFILSELQQRYGKHLGMEDVQWCLTVPAIWDEKAKQTMKACAEKAGMVKGPASDCSAPASSPFPLDIILEPEAASMYCQHKLKASHNLRKMDNLLYCQRKAKGSPRLRKGYKLLVADVGGSNIHLVVVHVKADDYPVNLLKVQEAVESYGEVGGGTYVDSRFFSFLGEKIGCFKKFCRRNPAIATRIYGWWQAAKMGFDGEGYRAVLPLPRKLSLAWEEYDNERGTGAYNNGDYDEVRLEDYDFMKIFRPEVEKVVRLIKEQIEGVRVLMVVGGFAASPYLRKRIRNKFRGMVDVVMVPEDPGSAICDGAVRLHILKGTVQSRIAKKTYGISICRSAAEGDPAQFLHVDDNGKWVCNNTFYVFVREGSRVPVGHSVEKSFCPSVHGQTSMNIVLYSSENENPKFTMGEDGVVEEGSFEVDISEDAMESMDRKRRISVTMSFGESLIRVRASRFYFGRFRAVGHGTSVVFHTC